MNIVHLSYPLELNKLANLPGHQVLAVGYFDGVHLGHQELIRRAQYIAQKEQLPISIMTFDPHPREVLGHIANPQYLTPLEEKLDLFAQMGVDYTFIFSFDTALSKVEPQRFIETVLFPLKVDTIVVGFNFTFGHLGRGTTDTLREYGASLMKTSVVRPFQLDGVKVSSTYIREMLHAGELEKVSELLGRRYTVTGHVVTGEGRGRTIGIPTANVEPDSPYAIPRKGVYAVQVHIDGKIRAGVMNIGVKPTFSAENKATLEVHILDFDQMIYGHAIRVEFVAFIREEQKFSSVEELVGQIHRDIMRAKSILA